MLQRPERNVSEETKLGYSQMSRSAVRVRSSVPVGGRLLMGTAHKR